MNLALFFQTGVKHEIDEAYHWYENQRSGLGEEFLTEVQATLERVVESPELHATIYKDVRRIRLKRFPYAVFYRVESSRITIVAVYHGKRDPSHLLRRI